MKFVSLIMLPLLLILIVATAIAGYFLIAASRQPAEIEEFVPEYSYSHEAELDYAVALKPNSLYDETVLGPEQIYYSKIIDNIDVIFSYTFTRKPQSPVEGTYGLVATIVCGKEATKDELGVLWQKEVELMAPTTFVSNSGTVSVQERLSLSVEEFEEIAANINEELGIGARSTYVRLEGWVRASLEPQSVQTDKELRASLEMPLKQAYFKISGERVASGKDSVGKTKTVIQNDVLERRQQAQIATIVLGTVTVALGIAVCFQSRRKYIAKKALFVQRVPRRYRDRIIESGPGTEMPGTQVIALHSLKELVKAADEVAKPIVHRCTPETDTFFVLDSDVRYEYARPFAERSSPE